MKKMIRCRTLRNWLTTINQMKYILAAIITAFALTANAGVKKPCKPGQTEADGCHVVKKAEKKKPAPFFIQTMMFVKYTCLEPIPDSQVLQNF